MSIESQDRTSRQHISLRLPTELLSFVDTQASAAFQTRSQFIVALVAKEYQAASKQEVAHR